jgi:hypothetical protein
VNLQELIGELQTLALAYPSESVVMVRDTRFSDQAAEISVVRTESNDTIVIVLEGV